MTSNNIKVSIKIRPLIQREKNDNLPSLWTIIDENTIKSNNKEYKLSFDHIFDEGRKTEELFNVVAKPIVENAVKGINGTIFAYGQTSSGKTYCMMGTDEEPGIVVLAVNEIFKQIELNEDREFLIRIGYIEIYNEKIYDLLLENKMEIKLHEMTSGEVVVNQTEIVSSSIQHILDCYNKGNRGRRVGETCMNERSSRSHTLFRIVIESHENGSKDGVFQVSTLNLVDLAGSERVDQTKATGERLREGGHINKSLLSLSKVIRELSVLNDEKSDGFKYINYRDSKLTRILSASLGGNAMTSIICTITPVALEETYSTLTFASNAKKIKNQPKVNETVSDKVIMTRLQKEISDLKGKLDEERSKNSEVSKIQKLIAQIFDRESQIIHFQHGNISKSVDPNRRRTWMCPTTLDKDIEEMYPLTKFNLMAPPPFILKQDSISPNTQTIFTSSDDFLSNEIFQSPDKIQFDKQMIGSVSRRNTLRNFSPSQIRTPRCLKTIIEVDSPQIGKSKSIKDENDILRARIEYLQNELEELQDFKMLEENIMSNINSDGLQILEENFERTQKQLMESEQKIEMLENDMMDKMIEMESLKGVKEKFDSMSIELKTANQEKQKAENLLESVKYEYEQAQIKFKNREKDLIQCLEEVKSESNENDNLQKEKIKNLEQLLRKTEEDLFTLELQKKDNQNEKVDESNKLSAMEKIIKDLETKLQMTLKEKERSEQTLKEKNNEIETLSDQIVESVQEIDSLEDRMKKMEEAFKLKDNELNEMTSKLTKLEEISNRYQKIQQIVTVEETQCEYVYDENDDIYKCIVELKQTATKTESLEMENKQLTNQIAENNRFNEEVENLRKQISDLEDSIGNKNNENENLLSKLSEHENMTNRLQKIQNLLLSDEPSMNDDDNDDICKLIIKLHQNLYSLRDDKLQFLNQINEIQGPSTDIEDLRKKIIDLEEEVKLRDSEKECLRSKLSELENIANHYQKIRDSLQSTEEPLENSDVIKQISDLHRMASRTELLENEKAQLLNEIAEIRQTAEILTEKLQNQTLSETEFQLRERNDAFEVELKETKERLDEQILKNNDIESNNLDLEIRIEEILKEKEDLLSQIEHLRNNNDGFQCSNCDRLQDLLSENNAKLHAYENEISQLTSKLDEVNIQNTELFASNENYSEQLLNIETELKETKEQFEYAKNDKNYSQSKDFEFQEKYEEVLKEKNDLLSKSAQLEGDVMSKINECEKLNLQLDENAKRIEEFENEIYKLSLKLDEAKIETAKVMESKADLQAILDQLVKEKENSSAMIDQLREDLESKNNEYSGLEVQLSDYVRKLNENEQEIAQLNLKHSTVTESSTDLNTQLEDMLKENESLLNEVEELKEVIGSKSSEHEGLKEQLDENARKLNDYEQEIAQLNLKYSTVTESSTDLNTQLGEILKEKESLLSEVEQLKEVIGFKNSEYEVLKEQLNECEKEISQLNLKHSTVTESSTDLNTQLQDMLKEKESLLSEVEQLKEVIGSKNSEHEGLKEQLDENARKLNDYEQEIAQLNLKYSTVTESSTDLNTQLGEILKEKESLLSEVEQLKEVIGSKSTEYEVLKEQLNEYGRKINDYEKEQSQLELKFNEISSQNTKLLDLNSDYMHQVSKLGAELTNSQSQILLKEEEFKNWRKEQLQINEHLKIKEKECEELKTRYRRRSEDNGRKLYELEMANSRLLQEVGAAEAIRTSIANDLMKMKEEYERIQNENSSLREENNNNDMKYSVLDEKYSQLSATNSKLEEKVTELKKIIESKNNEVIKKLEKEIIELNAKLWQKSTENESKAAIIHELNQKCDQLVKEVEENQSKPKKSFSPSHRRSDEKELFAPQHALQPDSNAGTPFRALKTNIERKTRRQSVYDERRDLSAWELTSSESTQTDPVDKLCRCDELDVLIKELRIEIRIRDSKIANAQRMANINIYKYQLEDAKLECQKEKREKNKLRDIIGNIEEKLFSAKAKIHELEKSQRSNLDVITRSAQTDHHMVLYDEHEKVLNEKTILEKKLNEAKRQLSQEKMLSEKENLSSNKKQLQSFTSNESDMSDRTNGTRLDYESLDTEYKTLQKKYDTAKKLCNLRMDDINKLRDELSNRNIIAEKMATKYEKAKQICEIRMEKIRNLREQLGENLNTKEMPDSITPTFT